MGRPILLVRLEAPLQSWGARSRWDVRDTETEPTKSGIIGLLGCALGYPMHDPRLETELDAGLRFGVRVENPGRILEDYQTITDFLPTAQGTYRHSGVRTGASLAKLRADPDATPATIISPRFYLEDAAFLVALEERHGNHGLLARCAEAIQRPVWPLYLGRKACAPTRPIFDSFADQYDSIEEALGENGHRWSWMGAAFTERRTHPERLTVCVEVEGSGGGAVRQDAMRINPARQYGFRYEARQTVRAPDEEA